MACQHSPDDQTLWLQAGAGEDDVIYLPSGLDRVVCERQEEEETPGQITLVTSKINTPQATLIMPDALRSALELVGQLS